MELKVYQKKALADLSRYLEWMNQTNNIAQAYKELWNEKGVRVGFGGMPSYQTILPGVPVLCMKVPTGGGKTFLACNAIEPIFHALPTGKCKAVVWLVPSDAILTQTLAALRNPDHPYRQKLDVAFGSRVEVYTKEQLLNGQNFNITALMEQLSVMVLSYDSFRGRKEQLKAKRENSNLAPIAKALGTPDMPLEDADETALLQIINQLNPLVIVDESHHARSTLSKKMLQDFNPCFVLDLTATPTKESNIITFVDAIQLKRENMVKLPVVVYNRHSQQDVLADAIDLRNHLELQAKEEQEKNSVYIRPIVLFQAQPKGKEESTTFEKLRQQLILAGIPANQIAIKTADINELKNVDLMSPDCEIRYIITVNALKEGWDCPFAYILASLANRTSRVEVEQIVGRVLRQPYTKRHSIPALNLSYVLTSSADFHQTLDGIVKGLNNAGFSEKDCRVQDDSEAGKPVLPKVEQPTLEDIQREQELSAQEPVQEEFLDFDPTVLSAELQQRKENQTISSTVQEMNETAEKEAEAFETVISNIENDPLADLPQEVKDSVDCYYINSEYADEVKELKIPQFFMKVPESLFTEGMTTYLEKEHLLSDFSLKGQPSLIDFDRVDDQIVQVDVTGKDGNTPKVSMMSSREQQLFKEHFAHYTSEQRLKACKDIIHKQLNRMDSVSASELSEYIDRIVSQLDENQIAALEKSPQAFALKIKAYIVSLQEKHAQDVFTKGIETGDIVVEPCYAFPEVMTILDSTSTFSGSLYQAEESVNGFEAEMVMQLSGMDNIKWWHRNPSKKGFCLNGFINHYPDFIVMTKKGNVVLIETKGDYLTNEETRQKLELGRIWQRVADKRYRYYMVFQSKDLHLDGAYHMDGFIDILKAL